jgi:hypothetical protein
MRKLFKKNIEIIQKLYKKLAEITEDTKGRINKRGQ